MKRMRYTRTMVSQSNTHTQQKVILIIFALLIALIIGAYSFSQWRQEQASGSQPPKNAPLSIVLGDQTSPDKKVIIYTDPVCDKCAAYHEDVVKPLYESHVKTGKLSIEIRPISIVSEHSAPLNRLVMCSQKQNAYLDTVSYISDNLLDDSGSYSEMNATDFFEVHSNESIAKSTGMKASQLTSCLKSDEFDNTLTQADTAAYNSNIYSTPTTFIGDHEPIRGYSSLNYIHRIIDIQLLN